MAQRQHFRVSDFAGGFNPDRHETLIDDNQAAEIRNLRLDATGSLVSRRGYAPVAEAPGTVLALGRYEHATNPSLNQLLAATQAGELKALVSGTWQTAHAGLSGSPGEFLALPGRCLYVNGQDAPVAYDGSQAFTVGVAAPSAAPSLAATSGGLTGTFRYTYTYYDSARGSESNPAPVSPISLTSQGAEFTPVPSPQARVDRIRVYRSTAGGVVPLLLAEVANAATPFVDDGSSPTALLAPPEGAEPPPKLEHAAYHAGYAFGSVGDTLYWSQPLLSDAWPALNSTRVPFEGNDRVVALVSFQDTLVVFGRRNIVTLSGAGGDWRLTRMDVDRGALSSRAIAELDGSLVYLTADGLRLFPGAQVLAPQLARHLSSLPPASLAAACMGYVAPERNLWLSVGDETYTVQLPSQAVSRYTFGTQSLLAGGIGGTGLPVFAAFDGSQVHQYGASASDAGQPIDVLWRSKVFSLGNPEHVKFIRRVGAFASTGATSVVSVTLTDGAATSSVALDSAGGAQVSVWGEFNWGEAAWSSEGVSYFIGALPADRLLGRTLQVTLTATTDSPLEIIPPITLEFREARRFLGA